MFMSRFDSHAYALLRIVSGVLFLLHGSSKLFGFPQPPPAEAPPFIIYSAGPIEFIGGLLIMLGLGTRWAAFICSGQMAAAYWIAHGTRSLFPSVNQGELAVLYCFIFLCISARGSGIWSLDSLRSAPAGEGAS